ncbi:MAG TPA: SAM-dependent methyltransferase [Chthoniobacterales bacterium]|jgi:tRNA-Thr(GGU) m(6)t(6)A37 methyltransferase TsaA
MTTITLTPIGHVISSRDTTEDDFWGDVEACIELCPEFCAEVFEGIEDFSHVEVVLYFDRVADEAIERGARHPRGNPAWPRVGIFAQRGKNRPNKLGVSVARLVARKDRQLILRGLDAINGTPVLDIKPVMREFLPAGDIIQPAWSQELMKHYWR